MVFLRNPEDFVPKNPPIRGVKKLADAALKELSPELEAMATDLLVDLRISEVRYARTRQRALHAG